MHCPTIAGNNKDDDRDRIGLEQAIASIAAYIEKHDLRGDPAGRPLLWRDGDFNAVDRLTDRIRRAGLCQRVRPARQGSASTTW